MTAKNLYDTYIEKIDALPSSPKKEDIAELKEMLAKNSSLLKDVHTRSSFSGKQTMIVVVFAIIGLLIGVVLSSFNPIMLPISILFVTLVGYLLSLLLYTSIYIYRTPAYVVYVNEILNRGWRYHNEPPIALWKKFSRIYPRLDLGEYNDDSIHRYISGKYRSYLFKYFEYSYTVEESEIVEYKDDDGETCEEVEYYDVTYYHICIAIDIKSTLPYILTARNLYSQNLKFSYIAFNEKVSAYSEDINRGYAFFDPDTQNVFLDFHSTFSQVSIDIDSQKLFVCFQNDMLNIPETLHLNSSLVNYFNNKALADGIEALLSHIYPIAQKIRSANI